MPRILVVDDDSRIRGLVVDSLQYYGFEAIDASDAHSGFQLAANDTVDLIVSDIMMPDIDGYQFLNLLRNDPRTNAIPVILATALEAQENLRQGMILGADDYITKPFQIDDLVNAINTQLAKRTIIEDKYATTLNILRRNIIYAMPHELRTPLQLILGYAELIETSDDDASMEQIRHSAHAISKAGTRLNRLFENYLVYIQLEHLSDPKDIEALRNHITRDASEIICQQATAAAEARERLGNLSLNLTPRAVRISGDNLGKIIVELVDNAFKFSEAGTPVTVQSSYEKGMYWIDVVDQGRGMKPEEIKTIGAWMQFNREFFEQQGIGMGLAIARRLIDLHDGQLRIQSIPGQGTLMRVGLPA